MAAPRTHLNVCNPSHHFILLELHRAKEKDKTKFIYAVARFVEELARDVVMLSDVRRQCFLFIAEFT